MINIPMETGYSPERWRKADDHMEQKAPDNFNIDRFRPIIHVEADFNMANGFIGRKVMHNAEKNDILAPEQYGSRKDKSAQDQALNKRLIFDVARQTKKPMVLVANDAKSCYDRILHVMVMLCARRTGLDLEPIMAMIDTIQLMAHQIHTAYGASLGYGPDDWDSPFQGILQGNQFGPPSWAIVSSPLFDMLRAEGYGLRIRSPLTRRLLFLAGLAFVDDTDTVQNEKRPTDTWQDVLRHAQGNVDHWNGGIRTTGGALDPKKTHWYLIDFTWKNGNWQYAAKDDMNKLTMVDSEGTRVDLKQLPTSKGMRTLGVILAPDGNNTDQVEALLHKAESWADLISTGHLQREEAWRALNSTILKSLEYPLTATTLTEQETTKIFSPIRQVALPASGIVRTFPSAIAHAPHKYQGLAIPDLYATQQMKHIITLLKFGGTNTVTGNLLQQSLEHMKIELGVTRRIQDIGITDKAFLLTDSWVKHTWLFMEKYYFTINEEPQFMLRRLEDGYLMEQFYMEPTTRRHWSAINKCRLFHRILTLSDITNGQGTRLRQDIWEGTTSVKHDNREDWPRQGQPSKSDWGVWQQSLMSLFDLRARDGTLPPQMQLKGGKVTPTWKWFYGDNTLYEKGTDVVKIYNQWGRRRSRRKRYRLSSIATAVPLTSLPCTVEKNGSTYYMTGTIQPDEEEDETMAAPSFLLYLKKKLSDKKIDPYQFLWIFDNGNPPTETQLNQLKESVEKEELIGCTDASTKDGISTASFKFQTKEGITVLQGEALIPGPAELQCSHRGEMGGAAAALTYLQAAMDYKRIKRGKVQFGCDSDNVVNVGLQQQQTTNSLADHYDLVRRCQDAREEMLPVVIIPVKVKGHTDNLRRRKTTMEKMNIECDERAGRRRREAKRNPDTTPEASLISHWQLAHQEIPILVKLQDNIRLRIQEYNAFEYWTETNYNKMTTKAFYNVHWDAMGKAMTSSTLYKRQFIAKHATGHCGVGKMMRRWGFRKSDRCPRCNRSNETALHVITCQHETANEKWDEGIKQFQEWLGQQKTDPSIISAIISNLRKWRKSGGIFGHHYDKPTEKALKEQNEIGWDHFMLGRISQQWKTLQEKYYKRLNLRKTGDTWARELIKEIWSLHWTIWNQRNETLHNTGNHKVLGTKEYEREIQKELTEGYAFLLPNEKYLLKGITMGKVRKWSANKKEKWLRTVQAARHTSCIRHQKTRQSRQNMHNWLKSTT